MTATKQCPSCGKQWPADAPYCGYCATSLHNIAPRGDSTHSEIPAVVQRGVDDEYMSMFRAAQLPDALAQQHLRRVDDSLLWAHVQRLTVVIWLRYAMAVSAGGVVLYALSTLAKAGGWAALRGTAGLVGWHAVAAAAFAWAIHQATSAVTTQAQRDVLVESLRASHLPRLAGDERTH